MQSLCYGDAKYLCHYTNTTSNHSRFSLGSAHSTKTGGDKNLMYGVQEK